MNIEGKYWLIQHKVMSFCMIEMAHRKHLVALFIWSKWPICILMWSFAKAPAWSSHRGHPQSTLPYYPSVTKGCLQRTFAYETARQCVEEGLSLRGRDLQHARYFAFADFKVLKEALPTSSGGIAASNLWLMTGSWSSSSKKLKLSLFKAHWFFK